MGLLDFLKPKRNSRTTVSGKGVQQAGDEVTISQYSEFPRYYVINGVKYDIDDPRDIQRIPLFSTILYINGEPYGMDALLNEHCVQCTENMDVHWAAYNKVQEFRKHGIIYRSEREIQRDWEREQAQEARRKKEESRKNQCDTFSVDDMEQFSDIPIAWSYIPKLRHTNGIAWAMLNGNNQKIVLNYISQVNDIIVDCHEYVEGLGRPRIELDAIDFDYPTPMRANSMSRTRIECYPYTATGKLSKYPVVIHFETKRDKYGVCTIGDIKLLQDGNIGDATVSIYGNKFKIGLHRTSLVLKRVDNSYTGNLFKFSEA